MTEREAGMKYALKGEESRNYRKDACPTDLLLKILTPSRGVKVGIHLFDCQ